MDLCSHSHCCMRVCTTWQPKNFSLLMTYNCCSSACCCSCLGFMKLRQTSTNHHICIDSKTGAQSYSTKSFHMLWNFGKLQWLCRSQKRKDHKLEDEHGGGQDEEDKAPGQTHWSAVSADPPSLALFIWISAFQPDAIFCCLVSQRRLPDDSSYKPKTHDRVVNVFTATVRISTSVLSVFLTEGRDKQNMLI